MHNIRIMRNMLINHPSHAFCNQPTLGDRCIGFEISPTTCRPARHAHQRRGRRALLQQHHRLGDQVAAASNIHWRNNLMLGQNSAPAILSVNTFTSYTSSDYNGFRVNPGAKAAFEWIAPPAV